MEEQNTRVNKKKKRKRKWIKRGTAIALTMGIGGGIFAGVLFWNKNGMMIQTAIKNGYEIAGGIEATDFQTKTPTVIYDNEGNVLQEFKEREYVYAELSDMNPYVEMAEVAIEDERFYEHQGIDYIGLTRSFINNIISDSTQGASTITQQLVKLTYLTQERIWSRKISEWVIAQEMENMFTKEQIMEFYVNNVYFGYGVYGIETASLYFFQKPSKELEVQEIAFLVGIPNNPSLYDPFEKTENVLKRKNAILFKMYELGYLSEAEYTVAKEKEIVLSREEGWSVDNSVTDYAISYAVDNATRKLMEANGFRFQYVFDTNEERAEYDKYYSEIYQKMREELLFGGYSIETSIDTEKQNELQKVVDREMREWTVKNSETGLYKKQASATTIDNKTGEVVAIVGGRSQEGNTYNRAYLGARQPGSTIKPIIAYTPYFDTGKIPSSTMNDHYEKGYPKNYNNAYVGSVTLRRATEISINTIPFQIAQKLGEDTVLSYLGKLEFRYLMPEDGNAISAVGGFTRGTTTVEMAGAYSAFANKGQHTTPTNVRKITRIKTEEVIYDKNDEIATQVYDSGSAYLMTDVLKGVITDGTGKNAKLNNYSHVAGKTGTTNGNKDAWMVGYTPYYTTAVWVGDDIPKNQVLGSGNEPSDIFREWMEELHKQVKVVDFEKPDTVKTVGGKLVHNRYLQKSIDSDRMAKEESRKRTEIANLKARLKEQEYRIVYGLTLEEETLRENTVKALIKSMREFYMTSPEQMSEVDELYAQALGKLEKVKRSAVASTLKRQIEESYNHLKYRKSYLESEIKRKEQEKKAEAERKEKEEQERLEQERLEQEKQQQESTEQEYQQEQQEEQQIDDVESEDNKEVEDDKNTETAEGDTVENEDVTEEENAE